MGERVCCCHVLTAAAVVGTLQLLVLALTFSGSWLMLDRWRDWEARETYGRPPWPEGKPEPEPGNGTEPDTVPERWSESFVELSWALYLGFCAAWAITLFFLALAVKQFKPVLVVPNLIALVFGAVLTFSSIVGQFMRIFDVDKGYRTDEYEESALLYMAIFLVICFLAEVAFIFVIKSFHSFLKESTGIFAPKPGNQAWED